MANQSMINGPDGKPVNRGILLKNYGVDSDAWRYKGYSFLPNNDDLVEKKGLEIYDTMMNEVEIENSVNALRYAAVAPDWRIMPASDSDGDVEAAGFVRWNFESLEGSVKSFLFETLSSVYRGYSVTEKIYRIAEKGRYAGHWTLAAFKAKYAGDYEIVTDEFMNLISLRLVTLGLESVDVPLVKFVLHIHNPHDGKPHGRSVLRKVYKHYWSKDFLLKWWNIYCETYGMPTRVARVPDSAYAQSSAGGAAGQTRLQNILEDIMNATAITIPKDIELEFKEVSSGGGEAFLRAIEYHDRQMRIGIMGQTLTTSEGDGAGSYALGGVHDKTKSDYVAMLRAGLEDAVMNEQVIKQLVDLNFQVESYPRFVMSEQPRRIQDLSADELQTLAAMGIIGPEDRNLIREQLGLPPVV